MPEEGASCDCGMETRRHCVNAAAIPRRKKVGEEPIQKVVKTAKPARADRGRKWQGFVGGWSQKILGGGGGKGRPEGREKGFPGVGRVDCPWKLWVGSI